MHKRHSEEYDYYKDRPERLERFNDLGDWQFGEGRPDIRGWNVIDRDGSFIGKLEELLVDTGTGQALFGIVSFGKLLGMGGKKTLMPLDQVDFDKDNNVIMFDRTKDDLTNAPEYHDDTRNYGSYYDYWGRLITSREPRDIETERERERELEREHRAERTGEEKIIRPPGAKRSKFRVYKQGEPIREVEPDELVLKEGETVRIPVVEERQVVTGEVVIEPETGREDLDMTEEEEEERTRHERR